MSKEYRNKLFEGLAKKFTEMDEIGKAFIAGYIAGKQEERPQQEHQQQNETPVA